MSGASPRPLDRLWPVYPAVVIYAQASPMDCLRLLAEATRPNIHKLHLRTVFTEGRRYYLATLPNGFRLTMDSALFWSRRLRTREAAVLRGEIASSEGESSRVLLRSRMRLLFLLDVLPLPTFVTSLILFSGWPPLVIALLTAAFFGLSYAWHHLAASVQAAEMVYFVQKALEEQMAPPAALLPAGGETIIDGEFREQWQKFYEEHRD